MKNKTKLRIFLVLAAVCVVFLGILCGCAGGSGKINELKAAYSYDNNSGLLIKFPSEIEFAPNELLTYENNKTKNLDYKILDLILPGRDLYTGEIYDYKATIGYAVYNNELVFTEVPVFYAPCEIYVLRGRADAFVITINTENAFLINLSDTGEYGEYSVKKLFDDKNIENYWDKNSTSKLIYAKTISVSPDGRYILYVSNRDYINSANPASLDIYYCDIQTGAEAKIMNFDGKEFLCWENLDINPGASGNFLFREAGYSLTGNKIYSDIRRYYINNANGTKEDIFFKIDEFYKSYEMIDDRYFYATEARIEENAPKKTDIYILDLYSGEIIESSVGKYSTIWRVRLSESKEYLAFFGSYINVEGIAIPEIVTLHLETRSIAPHYEQNEGVYFVGSFYWLPDNILSVNFHNTTDAFNDLSRLHKISHK